MIVCYLIPRSLLALAMVLAVGLPGTAAQQKGAAAKPRAKATPVGAKAVKDTPKEAAKDGQKNSEKDSPKVQNESPLGRWAARHDVNDDLQLWWQFKPNGTVNVTAGAIIRTTYKLQGNTLSLGKTSDKGPPGVFDILFDGGKLYTRTHSTPPAGMQFTRIGPAPAQADTIVGQWRLSDSVPSSDPKEEAIRQRLQKMTVSYRADGTYEARIPLDAIDGTWDAAAKTYTLKNYPPMPYQRQGPGLILVNPLKQTDKHTYYIDQYF